MSYITRDFLIEFVNAIVHKEVQGKNPGYNLHRWWARRVGTAFRIMLLTAPSCELDPVEETSATPHISTFNCEATCVNCTGGLLAIDKGVEIWYTILGGQAVATVLCQRRSGLSLFHSSGHAEGAIQPLRVDPGRRGYSRGVLQSHRG